MSSLYRKIAANKSRYLLVENELKKLKTSDWSYFLGKSYFAEDGAQNYLVFQPMYFSYIYYWQSKGLSDGKISSIKTRVEFNGSCFKQDTVTFNHGKVANISIVFEISKSINISDYPTLKNCLFGAVKLTKNADIDKHRYSGYGIGFDRHGSFSSPGIGLGRSVIIFGVDMSSSTKIDHRKNDILIFGKGPTQGLEHTLSAKKMYSINFTEYNKKFCLSLHYNGANSYLLVNGKEIHKFKARDSEIVVAPLCLGNISTDWTVVNIEKTGLNGYVYDFSVDHDAIAVDHILDVHNYLMKKNDIV